MPRAQHLAVARGGGRIGHSDSQSVSQQSVELRLSPLDISCTLSCIRESKASVDQ
eukprot:COSAG01_NODE_35191_length_535_cov_2.263761_1_plen_54_part_10